MKFKYYNTTIKNVAFNVAYCAGSSGANGIVDEILSVEWKSVLPLCTSCAASGAIPLTQTRRRNGVATDNGLGALVNQPLRLKPLLLLLLLLLVLMLFFQLRSHQGSS